MAKLCDGEIPSPAFKDNVDLIFSGRFPACLAANAANICLCSGFLCQDDILRTDGKASLNTKSQFVFGA